MPWSHCNEELTDDQDCPKCGVTKAAWTVQIDTTRTFQVSRKTKRKKKESWVAFQLEDGDDPVPDVSFELELPEGRVVEGTLDAEGKGRHEGIYPGECRLLLKDRDALLVMADGGEEPPDEEGWFDLETDREHVLKIPQEAKLHIRLPVDPGMASSHDDRFVLYGGDAENAIYEQAKTIKDDQVAGDAHVDLVFTDLAPDVHYWLLVDPGADAEPYFVFQDVAYADLASLGARS